MGLVIRCSAFSECIRWNWSVHNARNIKGLLLQTLTTKSKACTSVISYSSLHKWKMFLIKGKWKRIVRTLKCSKRVQLHIIRNTSYYTTMSRLLTSSTTSRDMQIDDTTRYENLLLLNLCALYCIHASIWCYTGCCRRNRSNVGRTFLPLYYTDITRNVQLNQPTRCSKFSSLLLVI
jgi:hypothetical protein